MAVGAAVWFALSIADRGLPSASPGPVVPTVAASAVARTLAPDRREHPSLPRERTRTTRAHGAPAKAPADGGGKTSGQSGSDDGSDGSTGDEPSLPPTETSDPPLLEANVPGVGSVTVEEPDLSDVDDVLPETPTVPLP